MINQHGTSFKANTFTTTIEQIFSELTHILIVWWLSPKCQEYTLEKWTSLMVRRKPDNATQKNEVKLLSHALYKDQLNMD